MSVSTPPVPRKRGLGCLGCGCLVLALLVFLFASFVGGMLYFGYKTLLDLTSTTPATIPSFEGGDTLYQSTRQKIADFDHDVKNHQAATIRFTSDEINTLIAHSDDLSASHIHAFVTLTKDEGRMQASVPTEAPSHGLMTGRYFNVDAALELHFDLSTRSVIVIPRTLQLGDKPLLNLHANTGANASSNQMFMTWLDAILNQTFNEGIRKNPDGAALLDQAKSIEIQDGKLVIETQ